jgi:hypothetical protein
VNLVPSRGIIEIGFSLVDVEQQAGRHNVADSRASFASAILATGYAPGTESLAVKARLVFVIRLLAFIKPIETSCLSQTPK